MRLPNYLFHHHTHLKTNFDAAKEADYDNDYDNNSKNLIPTIEKHHVQVWWVNNFG